MLRSTQIMRIGSQILIAGGARRGHQAIQPLLMAIDHGIRLSLRQFLRRLADPSLLDEHTHAPTRQVFE